MRNSTPLTEDQRVEIIARRAKNGECACILKFRPTGKVGVWFICPECGKHWNKQTLNGGWHWDCNEQAPPDAEIVSTDPYVERLGVFLTRDEWNSIIAALGSTDNEALQKLGERIFKTIER